MRLFTLGSRITFTTADKEIDIMGATRFIMAGRFIDGSGADVRRNVFLAVQDGVISAIGPAADLPRCEEDAITDFSHCTLLPALVDCSVFLARSPSVDLSVRLSSAESGFAEKVVLLEQHMRDCHVHGVQGVADNGDYGLVEQYQQGLSQGSIIDIRTSGRDFVRIGYSANIGDEDGPYPLLKYEDLGSILQHRGGKKAVVVANGVQQVEEALEAGCDAIEQGYGMGEDNLRRMAEKKVLWIPSLVRSKNGLDGARSGGDVCCRFSQRYVAPGKPLPGAERFWQKMLAEQLAQLRLARELGVTTAVGTGGGSVGILHGEAMVEELKLFIKAGYSLEETICCASENGARFFGMERLGALTVGRPAIFLITRGTVKQLPRKLSYLEDIYIDGVPSSAYLKNPVKQV